MQHIVRDYRLSLSMRCVSFIVLLIMSVLTYSQESFQLTFDKPVDYISQGRSDVVETDDGSIYISSSMGGSGSQKIRLIKINRIGITEFDTIYAFTPSYEFSPKMIPAVGGGVVIGCTSFSYPIADQDGVQDILVWKIDGKGTIEWQQVLAARKFYDITATKDQNYLITGTVYQESMDILACKIDPNGNVIWKKILGVDSEDGQTSWEIPTDLLENDGNIYIAGRKGPPTGSGYDGILMKLKNDGTLVWESRIHAEGVESMRPYKLFRFQNDFYFKIIIRDDFYRFSDETGELTQLTDSLQFDVLGVVNESCGIYDEVVAIAEIDSQKIFRKYNDLSSPYYEKTLPEFKGTFLKIIESKDGGYIILSSLSHAVVLTKTDCMGNLGSWSDACNSIIPDNNTVLIYPNPTQNEAFIESTFEFDEITIYAANGAVTKQYNPCNCKTGKVNLKDLASGLYVIQLSGEENESWSKLVRL